MLCLFGSNRIVGGYQITIESVVGEEVEVEAPNMKEIYASVASMRADSVLAAGFGLSRSTCAKLIDGEKAKCNGMLLRSSTHLKEGDVATLKGYGKMRCKEVMGEIGRAHV